MHTLQFILVQYYWHLCRKKEKEAKDMILIAPDKLFYTNHKSLIHQILTKEVHISGWFCKINKLKNRKKDCYLVRELENKESFSFFFWRVKKKKAKRLKYNQSSKQASPFRLWLMPRALLTTNDQLRVPHRHILCHVLLSDLS